ncbi:MAG: hypothetical protein KKG03_04960 [Gammaproteobacteria bacterium]|nr:hypothetical protein [Sideroxydans sp.]MBU3902918.1 hypothetical protein [Gammaproteobacteria bacterium]MBU4044774.1 hypothetical protein [Gammaproteobacteria bacterium]MBU4150985.1 hypothetical protein [Gammaproteobacteria bacterium]
MQEQTINITKLVNNSSDGLSAEERAALKKQLAEQLQSLDGASEAEPLTRARLQLDVAESLNTLGRHKEAWDIARDAFFTCMQQEAWADAVEACDVLFQARQPDSLPALGMGIWLSVTFPVDPELTVAMLIHVVDETPNDSDGAAVAAITARYVVDLRADDDQHESQSFLVNNLIAMVAQRHSNVQDQEGLDRWLNHLQLRDPQIFLPRLAAVVDAIVGDKWWFDRDVLRARLPE